MTSDEYVSHCWNLCDQFIKEDSKSFGKYIQLQVEKFKEWVNDPRYEFRTEEVDRVYRFFSYLNIYVESRRSYVQFPIISWQSFLLALIFGFYRVEDGRRKHTESLLFIARKNSKTSFSTAIVLYCFLKDNVLEPQSMLLAINQKQAGNALRYAKGIIYHSPALLKRLIPLRYKIVSKDIKSQGFIEIFSPIDPNRLESYSPSCCILDECHGFDSDKIEDVYNALKSGTGARENPLLLLASTAGTQDNLWFQEQVQYYKDVLSGNIDDDTICGLLFQPNPGMDLTSEETWKMANPSWKYIKPLLSDLRNNFIKAKNSASARAWFHFATRRINIFLEEPNDWLKPEKLDECFKPLNIEDFKDQECFLGVDLSITSDLSALAQVFHKDGVYYVFVYFFMANNPSKLNRKGSFDLKKYVDSGLIHLSDTGVVDYKALIEKVEEIDRDFRVVKLLYDRYNAPFVISEIQEKTNTYCEDFAQTPAKFNAPLKYMQDLVEDKKIVFDFNPVLRWNFSNVVVRPMDSNENIKIDKKKKKEAVDGVVAAAQALGGWMSYLNPLYQ